jgi:formate dehydrogenase gamma subunit
VKFVLVLAGLLLAAGIGLALRPAIAARPESAVPPPQAPGNRVCLSCHATPGLEFTLPSGQVVDATIDPEVYEASVHGQAGYACVQCHTDITDYPHPPVTAETRREYVLEQYRSCENCHESKYQAELDSVHQQALAAGNTDAAVCTDCHGAHDVQPADEPLSRPSRMCRSCHSAIFDIYADSVHGEALIDEGNPDVPGCTDCHGVHGVEGPATEPFRLFSPEICADCHADEELMAEYDISTHVFETYVSDFHGTTVVLFQDVAPEQETDKAVCVDCHGVHNILPAEDPESPVFRENLLATCQRCHPEAAENFPASWLGHYPPDPTHNPLVFFVNIFYWILIPVVLGGMVVYVIIDAWRRLRRNRPPQQPSAPGNPGHASKPGNPDTPDNPGEEEEEEERYFLRFPLVDRIQHWILTLSFGLLGLTGLIQMFPEAGISVALVDLLGGVETTRIIHRISAVVLMFETIYHLGLVGYRMFVLGVRPTMLPSMEDARAAIQWLRYNLGLTDERPLEGRYTFAEKMEYWALVWGTVIMGITGFMLWNPILTTELLPGEVIPAAKAAHGNEAVLAVAAIFIWHVYHVHIKHWNKSMFTGYLSKEEMEEEHPLELAHAKAKEVEPIDPDRLVRRRTTYLAIYGVLALVMLVGIYFYTSYEQTAIVTLPEEERPPVYAPLTATPEPTPAPQATEPAEEVDLTWEDPIGDLFATECASCHSADNALGGLDLTGYEATLEGGVSGPGVVPGDPAASQVIVVQAAGGHEGMFTGEQLARVRQWIEAGAPEE